MKQVQLYLTPYHFRLLRSAAHHQRLSMSELIRHLIEAHLASPGRTEALRPRTGLGTRMLAIATKAQTNGWGGPVDLSRRVDQYLYGKDS